MTHVTLKVRREDAQLIINTLAQLPFHQVAMLVPDLLRQANAPQDVAEEPVSSEPVAQETSAPTPLKKGAA